MPGIVSKTRGPTWIAAGIFAFLIGCLLYLVVPPEIRDEIGGAFYDLGFRGPWVSTLGVLALAAVGGLSGYLATTRKIGDPDRRQRWLGRGMRPLLLCGMVGVAVIVVLQVIPRRPGPPNFSEEQVGSFPPETIKAIQDARLTPSELNQVIVGQGTESAAGSGVPSSHLARAVGGRGVSLPLVAGHAFVRPRLYLATVRAPLGHQ